MRRVTVRPAYLLSITWDGLAEICRDLAARVAREFPTDVVVGVERVGTVPGALLAVLLRCDFQSLRFPDPDLPPTMRPHLPARALLAGRNVLVVDETGEGAVLCRAVEAVQALGAGEVRTAVLFSSPKGRRADYGGPELTTNVLQPWIRDTAMIDALRGGS